MSIGVIIWAVLSCWIFEYAHGVDSCIYPPCRFNLDRSAEDMTNIVVKDNTRHDINWTWRVPEGQWLVNYQWLFPGWYEGKATFWYGTNKVAFVSWGSNQKWEGNGVLIFARAWNMTYNGDIFGYIPGYGGRYTFRVFTKNKKFNPFNDDTGPAPPAMCVFTSNEKKKIESWWVQKRSQNNCPELEFRWMFRGQNGTWTVTYKRTQKEEKEMCGVFYKTSNYAQIKLITWTLNDQSKTIAYYANPVRVHEPIWRLKLGRYGDWGFTPSGHGYWIFQFYGRNLILKPFQNMRGTIDIN